MSDAVDTAPPPKASFYGKWLSAEGYLGLHLVVGFVIALLTGIVFDTIADEVFESPVTLWADATAIEIARSIQTPWLSAVMHAASFVGGPPALTVLSIAVALALWGLGSKRRLALFAAVMGIGPILNRVLKLYFQRARPEGFDESLAHGYSFPSGHSMGSMLFFGALAYVLYFTLERSRATRISAVVACFLAVLLVGSSRIYLGVHYFSDVVAGFAAGLCWIGISVSGVEAWVRWREWRRRRAALASEGANL